MKDNVSLPDSESQEIVAIVDGISRECGVSHREGSFLYRCARHSSQTGVIVEIGSWKGVSTIWLARGSMVGSGTKVYAIDPHKDTTWHIVEEKPEDTYPIFRENIKKAAAEKIVKPLVMRSDEAIKGWSEPIGLLWIDGSHEYEDAKKDFTLYEPYLLTGGIVAFHDCWHPGVSRAIRENLLMSRRFQRIGQLERIIFAFKTRESSLDNRQLALRLRLLLLSYTCDVTNLLTRARFLHPFRRLLFNSGKKTLALINRW